MAINILLKQFISTTPLKPFIRILLNFIVKMDILCTCINLRNFFLIELFINVSSLTLYKSDLNGASLQYEEYGHIGTWYTYNTGKTNCIGRDQRCVVAAFTTTRKETTNHAK